MAETMKKHPNLKDFPLDCPPGKRFESYTLEEIEAMIEQAEEEFRNGIVPDTVYGRPLDQLA